MTKCRCRWALKSEAYTLTFTMKYNEEAKSTGDTHTIIMKERENTQAAKETMLYGC